MKIRQARKLLLRPVDRMPQYWLKVVKKEHGRSVLLPYRDSRLQKACVTLSRWYKNYKFRKNGC